MLDHAHRLRDQAYRSSLDHRIFFINAGSDLQPWHLLHSRSSNFEKPVHPERGAEVSLMVQLHYCYEFTSGNLAQSHQKA